MIDNKWNWSLYTNCAYDNVDTKAGAERVINGYWYTERRPKLQYRKVVRTKDFINTNAYAEVPIIEYQSLN